MKQQGSSLVELLMAVALSLSLLATVCSEVLIIKQSNNQLADIRLAQQLLHNVATELTLSNNQFNGIMLQDWQNQIQKLLPSANLKIVPQANQWLLEVLWPSQKTFNANCQSAKAQTTCLGLLI